MHELSRNEHPLLQNIENKAKERKTKTLHIVNNARKKKKNLVIQSLDQKCLELAHIQKSGLVFVNAMSQHEQAKILSLYKTACEAHELRYIYNGSNIVKSSKAENSIDFEDPIQSQSSD